MPTSSTDIYALLRQQRGVMTFHNRLGRCTTLRKKKRTTDFIIPWVLISSSRRMYFSCLHPFRFSLACWAEIFLYFHKFGNISYNYSILLQLIKTAITNWPRTFSVWLSLLKLRSGNIIANHDWFAKFWCLFSAWVRTFDTNSILKSRDCSGT